MDRYSRILGGSWWCSVIGNNEDRGDDVVDGDGDDEAMLREYEDEMIDGFLRTEYRTADIPFINDETLNKLHKRKCIKICFWKRRQILRQIFDAVGGGHCNDGKDDGGRGVKNCGSEQDDGDNGGRGGGGMQLDLMSGRFLLYHCRRRYDGYFSQRLRLYEKMFAYDLIGCLRRHHQIVDGELMGISEKERTSTATDPHGESNSTTSPPPPPPPLITIRHVRICPVFLQWLNQEGGQGEMLMETVSNLYHMESFHATGDDVSCQTLMPVLKRIGHFRRQRESHLKELRLGSVVFDDAEQVRNFAACLAPETGAAGCGTVPGQRHTNKRWNNLTSLEIEIAKTSQVVICLDPIIHAVCGSKQEEGRHGHLPCLETFRLTHWVLEPDEDSKPLPNDNDDALIRLFKKPSLRRLALRRFLKVRHCHLMRRHLSRHANIRELEVSIWDFVARDRDGISSPKETAALEEAMQCLTGLVHANPNITRIGLGECLPSVIGDKIRQQRRDINLWTGLNRNGLDRFRVAGAFCDPSSSSSAKSSWTRRECVDFLVRLAINDRGIIRGGCRGGVAFYDDDACFTDTMVLEALFLSIQLRPDLCQRTDTIRSSTAGRHTIGGLVRGLHELTSHTQAFLREQLHLWPWRSHQK